MPSMQKITCKCGRGMQRLVRVADVKRGWGLFFSKECKARHQERKTHGQYRRYQERQDGQPREPFVPFGNFGRKS